MNKNNLPESLDVHLKGIEVRIREYCKTNNCIISILMMSIHEGKCNIDIKFKRKINE